MTEPESLTQLKDVAKSGNKQRSQMTRLFWIVSAGLCLSLLAVLGIGVLVLQVRDNGKVTKTAVSHEIPGLKQQLAEERAKNADLTFVLTRQAVPEIQNLAGQVQSLGGDPGQIVLDPHSPPVTPTTTIPKGSP